MLPIYTYENPIVCSTTAERDALLLDHDNRVAGLSVTIDGILYFLNSDLQTWSSPQPATVSSTVYYCATQVITSLSDSTHFDFGGHSLAIGETALFPYSGTGTAGVDYFVGRYSWSGTAWVAIATKWIEGYTIACVRSADSPTFRQSATTGSAIPVFSERDLRAVYDVQDPTDDAPKLQLLLNANAYRRETILSAKTYTLATTLNVPSGTKLTLMPGAIVKSTCSGIPAVSIQGTDSATSTTLSANTTGTNTVQVGISIAGGSYIAIRRNAYNRSQVFKVISVAGSSPPYTLTLDRRVRQLWKSGDPVVVLTAVAKDITISGKEGCLVSGTGSSLFNVIEAENVLISGINIDATYGEAGTAIYAQGCIKFRHDDITVNGNAAANSSAIQKFSCERSFGNRTRMRNLANLGWLCLDDCVNCGEYDFDLENTNSITGTGVMLSSNDSVANTGCIDCKLRSGVVQGFVTGVSVNGAALNCRIEDVSAVANTYGIAINYYGTNWYTQNTLVQGCSVVGNGYGYQVDAGCKGTRILACSSKDNSQYAYNGADEITIDGLDCKSTSASTASNTINFASGSYTARLRGIQNGICVQVVVNANVTLYLGDCVYGVPSGGGVCVGNVGTAYLTNCNLSGQYFGYAGSTSYLGENVTVSSINRDDSTAHFNRGILTANGATPVAVPFRGIVAEDQYRHVGGSKVLLTCRTPAGTQGVPPYVAITAGVGFTATAQAGDTSVYDYAVI